MDRREFVTICAGGMGALVFGDDAEACRRHRRRSYVNKCRDEVPHDWSSSLMGADYTEDLPADLLRNPWSKREGSHRDLGHNRVRKSHRARIRDDWWEDPCTTSEGWTCYGPYEPMVAGEWVAYWAFRVEFRTPRIRVPWPFGVSGELGLPLVEMDVVAGGGSKRIAGPAVVTWGHAFAGRNHELGTQGYDDVLKIKLPLLRNKLDDVEVRIKSRTYANRFYAKEMWARCIT